MVFRDRIEAGEALADRLEHLRGEPVVVLAMPRGGVPVGVEVASRLGAPLDVILVRKLGVPFQPELAMGAIGEGGVVVLDEDLIRAAGVSREELDRVAEREGAELDRRAARYREGRPRVPVEGATAVVVDDGVATGSSAAAACRVARAAGAVRVVLAAPVAPPGWESRLGGAADEYVAVATPDGFMAIGQFYADFSQVDDDEVLSSLRRADRLADGPSGGPADRPADRPADAGGARGVHVPPRVAGGAGSEGSGPVSGEGAGDPGSGDGGPGGGAGAPGDPFADESWDVRSDEEVAVDAGPLRLPGRLTVPAGPRGLVLFAHGSGSSRHSSRNRYVAAVLNRAGLATLLFDLLTDQEERDRSNVFDVELLAARLTAATRWSRSRPDISDLPIGYFGASTGAAAALWAAAGEGPGVAAVVSRGGRPDLAAPRLGYITAPTLLIVGGDDRLVLELNEEAQAGLRVENRLIVIPGASHLFEEPGTLDAAADAARNWFVEHLPGAGTPPGP